MSIDDISRPAQFSGEHWRAVLHDAVDQVLDEILDVAEDEWPDDLDDLLSDDVRIDDDEEADEPPGDPPSAAEIAALGTDLREGLAAAILHGTWFWGCDGSLRCTGEWAVRCRLPADRVLGEYRRIGVDCDCAVLHTVLGRTDVGLRCPIRLPEPSPEDLRRPEPGGSGSGPPSAPA